MSLNSSKLLRLVKAAAVVVWVAFGFILAQAIGVGATWGLVWLEVPLASVNETLYTTAANIIVYTLALAIIIGVPWLIKKVRTSRVELGARRILLWKDILWALGGFAAYFVLTIAIGMVARLVVPGADYSQAQDTGFNQLVTHWEYTLTFLSLVIIAPVAEELIFRGYLLGKLVKYVPTWTAIILSALLFAVAHGQFNVALDTFALGVALAFVRIKSGSVWAAVLIHSLKNAIAFYLLFVNPVLL